MSNELIYLRGGAQYTKDTDANGCCVLKRYNEEHRLQMVLHFSDCDIGVSQEVKNALGKQFIDREVEELKAG
jgi:hypothetical protein